jgi:ribosome-associated protein
MTEAEQIARACAEAAADKKAEDIVLLDLRNLSSFTDFFLICSASSEPQLKAISSAIREQLREKHNRKTYSEDGFPISQWIVLDFGDVIVHLFHSEKRGYYSLEKLWGDAPQIPINVS